MKASNKLFIGLILGTTFLFACDREPTGPETSGSYSWEVSTPQEQGFDAGILRIAFEEARERSFINSIVIVRNGYLVSERYLNGFDRDDAHNVRSVSKSILSALVGIALRESALDSLDQRVLDFFPEYITSSIDPRKYNITIRHLLKMRAGFDGDHNTYSYIYSSPNWVKTTIELPLISEPDERFSYNTFLTHLLSAILTKASGMTTLEFANRYLLEPLAILCEDWATDPQGYYFGGTDMFFTPRDMARFGYLYLNNGLLEGKQIVPGDWVAASLTNYTGRSDWTWGVLKNINYGYLWWLGEINDYEVFLALGHGGQFIICFPALNMIVVTTANSDIDWDQADEQERSVLQLVAAYLLPAVIG